MYWTCFAAGGIGSVMLILAAQRVVRSGVSLRLVLTLLINAGLFFGVSMGCGAGIFVFKKRVESGEPAEVAVEDE